MESSFWLLLVLIATFAIIHNVQAQNQEGFISLDCGLPADELSPYIETSTKLNFSSDATFIQSGKTARVEGGGLKPYKTIRYFPDGTRNCYNLKVQMGSIYLIRASFIYRNYDGRHTSPVFDLYLGPNLWVTIDLETEVNGLREEILHVPTSNSLQICLAKTGETTPVISALELRPMGNDSYITKSGSLKHQRCYCLTNSSAYIRYSSDIYDRIWDSYFQPEWTQMISTALDVVNSNKYAIPKDVIKNAATPTDTSAPLTIEWRPDNPDDQYYYYAHFAEIQDLLANETREFNVLLNGVPQSGPFIPRKRTVDTISSKSPQICSGGKCIFQLTRTKRSTLPPLLNAFEFYRVVQFTQSETDERDVLAIKRIAATYGLNRISWQGDPCVPQQFRWDGLNCTNTMNMSMPPKITTLNLSSSGLTGTIATAIQNLTQLETMDLSNNNLTGGLPDFLGNMKWLSVINLSGNNLSGSIPQALQREGLKLFVEGNPRLCFSGSCIKPHKKKTVVTVVASVTSAAILIAILVLFLVFKNKKSTVLQGQPRKSRMRIKIANKNSRRFTYSEVIQMTNNFQRVLGKGGFGMVYHGTVNGSNQVAVKVVSQSSTQGYKEFKAEVDLLVRVHHTNLVILVGYCYEGDHLALVYEFLPNGDLKQHLSGKRGRPIINWGLRLQIALDTALGLEYLHIGCTPPMVHRDVKTANILLDENYKAKLADFGLSRSFQSRGESHESTVIAGTIGYLDPEYYRTGRLAEKSDVYSYGVVLLEMITNRPVISKEYQIAEWVAFTLNRGDITEIMDPNLGGVYDSNSAWRALELAMSCADPISSKRPTMSQVIIELKECIACENSRMNTSQGLESQ